MITIVEMLIRAPEGRLVFQSMLGTVTFTVAFVAGAMYLIQDCLFRFQRYNVILLHGSRRCAAIFFAWSRPPTTFLVLQPSGECVSIRRAEDLRHTSANATIQAPPTRDGPNAVGEGFSPWPGMDQVTCGAAFPCSSRKRRRCVASPDRGRLFALTSTGTTVPALSITKSTPAPEAALQ